MSWLSDEEICEKVERNGDEKIIDAFYGVCALDELPKFISQLPIFIVVNTQTHNLEGEHWKTIFIDKNRNGEIFDSLAQPMSAMLTTWMNRFTRRWKKNHKVYQHVKSSTCGAYALFYVLHRLDCLSMKMFTNFFSDSLNANETIVRSFYKTLK